MAHRTIKYNPQHLIAAGACILCFLSAAINIHFVRLLNFAVGYLAGDILRLYIHNYHSNAEIAAAITLLLITIAFIMGAITAGLVIHHPRFNLERPYGRSLMSIGIIFGIATLMERNHPGIALPLAAFASGLQNALATRYRGAILRTTHITGIVTDFGQAAGMCLAGHNVDPWKIWLYCSLFLSFLLGAGFGLLIDWVTSDNGGLVISTIYVIFGVLFFTLKRRFLESS